MSKGTDTNTDIFKRVEENISQPEDLLNYAKATRLMAPRENKSGNLFRRLEEFTRYFAVAAAAFVSVMILILNGFLENAKTAISINESTVLAHEKILQATDRELSVAEQSLKELRLDLEKTQQNFNDVQNDNTQLTNEVTKARLRLEDLNRRIAEEKIVGAGLFICTKEKVAPIYVQLSNAYNLEGITRKVEEATLRIFLLRDEELIFNTFVKEAGKRYPSDLKPGNGKLLKTAIILHYTSDRTDQFLLTSQEKRSKTC